MTTYHQTKVTMIVLQNTCIFLLTEIPQVGKQGKRLPHSPNHPKTPDSFFLTWLDNNEINTCTNLLPSSPSKSPTVNQQTPMLHASQVLVMSASGTGYILPQYKKEHHHFPFSTSASPTRILLANRCVDHWSYSYLLQIVTRISDQQI